jgi:GxxExxY protein
MRRWDDDCIGASHASGSAATQFSNRRDYRGRDRCPQGAWAGLLESAYEACLYHELVKRGLRVERQKPLPLVYGEVRLECAYRMDLVVEDSVVIEVKAVTQLGRVHEAQMISYLKISGLHVGLVLNFNVKNLIDDYGIMRKVNDFPE